ncbi:MAG: hypothetical protein ABFS05_12465, partial [Bacteroidota bacterium]
MGGIYTHSLGLLFIIFLIMNLGQSIADVATDALVLETDKADNIIPTINFKIAGTVGGIIFVSIYNLTISDDFKQGWEWLILSLIILPMLMIIISHIGDQDIFQKEIETDVQK